MEEKEVQQTNEAPEAPKAPREVKFSTSFLFMLFAITSLALFVVVKICEGFAVSSNIFYGIMSIVIYCLPFVGMVLSYVFAKKASPEFWANVSVLGIELLTYPASMGQFFGW